MMKRLTYNQNRTRSEVDGSAQLQLQSGAAVRADDRGVGDCRHGGRCLDRGAAGMARTQLWHSMAFVRKVAAIAYQCSDLCVWRMRAVLDFVSRRAAHLSGAALRRQAGGIYVLGLAGGDH